ncbi:MAG: 50S ribosomal protein L6 [Nanoarchaeota archaeon]
MRKKYDIKVAIPDGISCKAEGKMITCNRGNTSISRKIFQQSIFVSISGSEIVLECANSNKKDIANIHTQVAHLKNILLGLKEPFSYELEICNVHFPMTVKVDGNKFLINNFLGEKVSRSAEIIEGVNVKIEGSKVLISSADIEKAGQTAANIEKAARVTKKDRRIFQDGIFITKKPEVIL